LQILPTEGGRIVERKLMIAQGRYFEYAYLSKIYWFGIPFSCSNL